ncbi:hypothetical protein ACFQX9_35310 [Bradyrhizobium sp. GCM10028915]|uniref:hypothetical protein n=1 Tax=Bradyrhizobium sp. GCM10028915 TaxID=3273385 RepID=UPI00361A9915
MGARQLAGEYGSSEHGEESFDAGELSGERFFDTDADAVRPGKSLDDLVNADRSAAGVACHSACNIGSDAYSMIVIVFMARQSA